VIDLLAAKRRCTPMGGALFFGGSSKSSQATKNIDARVVGGESSVNTSQVIDASGGSRVRITSTDHGAVSKSLDLAMAGVEGANTTTRQVIASQGSLLEGALKMSGEQSQKLASTVENLKGNDVRVLVVAGLAVVGVAAVTLIKRKG
jgi:hypothetical protein